MLARVMRSMNFLPYFIPIQPVHLSYCIYCGLFKNSGEFSKEHVFPQAIGGNLEPTNPFTTKAVWRQCNSRVGQYVDGPFIKSWLLSGMRAGNAIKYCSLEGNSILPLRCMGQLQIDSGIDKVCDFWMGPANDLIYHFHDPYPSEPNVPPIVGPPTNYFHGSFDPGFALVFINASNPVWHRPILSSISKQFPKSELYAVNTNLQGYKNYRTLPSSLEQLKNYIKANYLNREHKLNIGIGINFESRFLCKLALGIGYIKFGEEYAQSEYADLLRTALWTPSLVERQKIPLRGTKLNSSNAQTISRTIKYDAGHSLALMKAGNDSVIFVSFFGQTTATIVVSDDARFSQQIAPDHVYTLCPALRRCSGPIDLHDYLAHRLNEQSHPELTKMDNDLSIKVNKPPFMI